MTIIIVEGPAGAGKSTWIKERLTHHQKARHVENSLSKAGFGRFFTDNRVMAITSLSSDIFKISNVLASQMEGFDPIYVDRLYLSQLVYGSIREDRPQKITKHMLRNITNSILALFNIVHYELYVRGLKVEGISSYDFQLSILCPKTYEELKERRKTSGKEYPTGKKDWTLYRQLIDEGGFHVIS